MAVADTQITGRDRSGTREEPHHPVVVRIDAQRCADFQLRIADRITAFAGSMRFVYLHALAFAAWADQKVGGRVFVCLVEVNTSPISGTGLGSFASLHGHRRRP
jgi:hypothetical protein